MATKVNDITASTSANARLAFNIGTLKTKNGLLRLFEMFMGMIFLVILFFLRGEPYEYVGMANPGMAEALFTMCVLSTLPVTFLLLVSYLASPVAAETLPKLLLELMHNVLTALFYFSTSLAILIAVAGDDNAESISGRSITEIVLGVGTSVLYGINSLYSYSYFKST